MIPELQGMLAILSVVLLCLVGVKIWDFIEEEKWRNKQDNEIDLDDLPDMEPLETLETTGGKIDIIDLELTLDFMLTNGIITSKEYNDLLTKSLPYL